MSKNAKSRDQPRSDDAVAHAYQYLIDVKIIMPYNNLIGIINLVRCGMCWRLWAGAEILSFCGDRTHAVADSIEKAPQKISYVPQSRSLWRNCCERATFECKQIQPCVCPQVGESLTTLTLDWLYPFRGLGKYLPEPNLERRTHHDKVM